MRTPTNSSSATPPLPPRRNRRRLSPDWREHKHRGRRGGRARGGRGHGGKWHRAARRAAAAAAETGLNSTAAQLCLASDAPPLEPGVQHILLRMAGNDKFLAPREQGVVYAAVRKRFRDEGTAPLSRIAWRVVPRADGWVQLQHVLTGRWLRLVPPPNPVQWLVRAETSPEAFGHQTWFRLETAAGVEVRLPSGSRARPVPVHVRCRETGAYINYRGRHGVPMEEDLIRGHGNKMRGNAWVAATREPTTAMHLESVSVQQMREDQLKWKHTREACLAPCVDPAGAAANARAGGAGWSEVCWKHFAEPTCNALLRAHGEHIRAGAEGQGEGQGAGIEGGGEGGGTGTAGGGEAASAAHLLKARWARLDCDKYVEAHPPPALPAAPLPSPSAPSLLTRVDCAPLVEGVLLLLVSDRPNQFVCHYLESALLHGLSPTVLGWDHTAWADPHPKPWTYYLGGKLVLPLTYLERCGYPDDALVIFTDHDVVFQGGYAELKRAYAHAVELAKGAPLIFSAEKESYPLELQPLYPRSPSDPTHGPARFLNSGMWMGPVGAAKGLLKVMTGVSRGESMARLLRHYLMWGRLDTKADPIPAAYAENDQVKYAGLYVAQEMALACGQGGRGGRLRGKRCYRFLHDGQYRCAHRCSGAETSHPALPRIALDRTLVLFENMFHAGAHAVTRTGALEHRGQATPLVLHFNGPAKVSFEREWGLPWDPTAGKTPVLHLIDGLRRARSEAHRRAAALAFETNVTFLTPYLRRAPPVGPLRFSCDVPW